MGVVMDSWCQFQGQGDLASKLGTPVSHGTMLVIPIVDPHPASALPSRQRKLQKQSPPNQNVSYSQKLEFQGYC